MTGNFTAVNTAAKRMRMRHLRPFPVCSFRINFVVRLAFEACCCESAATDGPQIRKLRYVDNSLFVPGNNIFEPRSDRH